MTNYGNCEYCGAEKVKNPRTGKIFCSKKCWLNKPKEEEPLDYTEMGVPRGGSYVPPARKFPPRKQEPNWDEINARKEEGMTFLNAKNNAAVLLAAAIKAGEMTLEVALQRYDSVTQAIYDIGKTD